MSDSPSASVPSANPNAESKRPQIEKDEPMEPAEIVAGKLPAEKIVYDLPLQKTASDDVANLVEATKEKFAARASRFGETVKPKVTEVDVLGARRAVVRDGFATGFDLMSQDELKKREARAKRFGEIPEIGTVDEERAARAKRFGLVDGMVGLENMDVKYDPLERRRDVAVGELARPNVLHVFGVDDLSTNEILKHFREYGPSWCEWLNDSSCNIAFEDEHTTKRALYGVREIAKRARIDEIVGDAPADKMGDDEGAGTSVAVAGDGTLSDELVWHSAKPFQRGEVLVPLWVRQATEKDKRPELPNPKSKWSRNVLQKQKEEERARRASGGMIIEGAKRSGRGSEYIGGFDEDGMQTESRRRRKSGTGERQDRRNSRRGMRLAVHNDKAVAIMKARSRRISKMDLDRALES